MNKILIVEDDSTTADFIARGLTDSGYEVAIATNGHDGIDQARTGGYDVIILDRMMPGMDGLEMLTKIRADGNTVPVIVLSALANLDERVKGLRAGSDDYLAKPFALAELMARIEAVRRRGSGDAAITKLSCEDLEMDLLARKTLRGGRKVDLQPREFRLLEFLMRHRDQVVTRTMLLEGVWDYHFDPGTNVIDVHVSRLRKKIDEGGAKPLLHTVRGAGYRLGAS